MRTRRYRFVEYIKLLCEQKEAAFRKWRASGYRDDSAYNDWAICTHLALRQAAGKKL